MSVDRNAATDATAAAAGSSDDESPALFSSPRRAKKRPNVDDDNMSMASTVSRREYKYWEDETIARYIKENGLFLNRKGNAMWHRMAEEGVLEDRSWQSMKNRFLKTIAPSRSVREFITSPTENGSIISKEVNPRIYTALEDRDILQFIVKNKRVSEVKGIALWEQMEARNIAGGRSAHSMKERFRKKLAKNLEDYSDIVPEGVRQRIGKLYK